MRPRDLTSEMIIAAGKKLLAEGKNVTPMAIRKLTRGGDICHIIHVWNNYQLDNGNTDPNPSE
jgi:hypothetical protein